MSPPAVTHIGPPLQRVQSGASLVLSMQWCPAALSGTGRRALRDAASSPTVSLENENFREAETWEYAVSMPGEIQSQLAGLCIIGGAPV